MSSVPVFVVFIHPGLEVLFIFSQRRVHVLIEQITLNRR